MGAFLASRWSRSQGLIAATLMTVGLSVTHAAADDWGSSAYKGWATASVTIEGIADKDLAEELKQGLALALTKGILGRERPTFFPRVLAEDVQRATLFMARRGFPYATVEPRLRGSARREEVHVVFTVDPGPPVTIGTLTIAGLEADQQQHVRKDIVVAVGERMIDAEVQATERAIVARLLERGHAAANAETKTTWIDRTRVALTYDVEPGPIYYFGQIDVRGADEDLVPLVKKTVKMREGDRFTPEAIEGSHRNLRVLDLFRQVRLSMVESADDTLDVVIEVSMRDQRTLETIVSYFNDEHLKVGARWIHRNLLEKGRGVQFDGLASQFHQEVGGSVWWPGLLISRTRLVFGLSARRENELSYEAVSVGGDLSLRYAHSLHTNSRGGIEIRDVTVDEKGDTALTDLEDGLTTVLFGSFDRNRGNDWIVPTAGTIFRWQARWAPSGSISDNQFVSTEVTGIWYVPVADESVVALRGVVGLANPLGQSPDLLPNERFYSGGANSMRGFERRKLGPKNASGDPVGGEALFEAGVEARFRLVWKFRGALFADAGQVWSTIEEAKFNTVEVAVGPGLWLSTPVGPLRLDYAYRLTDFDKLEPRSRWVFSIGPAF